MILNRYPERPQQLRFFVSRISIFSNIFCLNWCAAQWGGTTTTSIMRLKAPEFCVVDPKIKWLHLSPSLKLRAGASLSKSTLHLPFQKLHLQTVRCICQDLLTNWFLWKRQKFGKGRWISLTVLGYLFGCQFWLWNNGGQWCSKIIQTYFRDCDLTLKLSFSLWKMTVRCRLKKPFRESLSYSLDIVFGTRKKHFAH